MDGLDEYRTEIDKINSEIVKLLARRVEVVKEIGKHKADNSIEIIDSRREEEIYKKLREDARNYDLPEKYIRGVFKIIIEHSRGIQK